MGLRRGTGMVVSVVLVGASLLTVATGPVSAVPDAKLTRYPYLTDLVGKSVTVNWATNRSAGSSSVGYVKWGTPGAAGACTGLTPTANATRSNLAIGPTATQVLEYQWKAVVTFPTAGTYCYRVYLASNGLSELDVLGSDAAPTVTTQVPTGSSSPFSFAVLGDWGEVASDGTNPHLANVMARVESSGVRFALTTGDNAYNNGSQEDYGDLQQTTMTGTSGPVGMSAIFGPSFWAGPGRSIPLFPSIGNHGLVRSDAIHPHLLNWPQDNAVATSGGRYQLDTFAPTIFGTQTVTMPSLWYAFQAGNARFYVLEAAWPDNNVGTADGYANDYEVHWKPGSPEIEWLKADLAAHPGGVKFAVVHKPFYSVNPNEKSDPYLRGDGPAGSNSLERVLASAGVSIAFNGHAHIYERNAANGSNSLVSYLVGGSGARLAPVQCNLAPVVQYALGWSYSANGGLGAGSACGSAPVPASIDRVHHFLKVTVNGSLVTVTPTDEMGRTFDVQTYDLRRVPGAPTGLASTAGNGGVALSWTAPASDGGAAISDYQVSVYDGVGGVATGVTGPMTRAVGSATTSLSFTGLTNGTAYRFKVAAVNAVGTGTPSALSAVATPQTVPTAPTSVAPTAGDARVALTWAAPASDGGVAISDYQVRVYSSVGGTPTGVTGATTRAVGSAATSFAFTGLTNGTAYAFKVSATNAAGTGPASALSGPALVGAPAAPTGVTAVSGSTASATGPLVVSFVAGANNGSAITGFTATCLSSNGGAPGTGSGAASPITVPGLTTGKTYACTVKATNARGTGPASAPSAPAIVGSPAAPTSVKAVSGSTTSATGPLVVSFVAGANNGSAITGFTATCVSSNGGVSGTGSGAASPITVPGLTTGKTYACTVKATNARGTGPASAPSGPVIEGSPLAPPTVKAVSGSTTAATGPLVVSFVAGANNGSAITGFTATCASSNGGVSGTASGAASPLTLTGLTTGKTYACTVKATNARGTGLSSVASLPVILGSPGAPTSVAAVRIAAGSLRVSFVAGPSNGSAITGFTATCVSSNGGVARAVSGAASPITVTALTAGKTYMCVVKGTNARGTGLASIPSSAVVA